MRVPPTPFDDEYDVCGSKATRVGKESARTAVPVFHRPAEGIRLSRPHTYLAGARSPRNTAADDRGDPPIPRWDESMRAKRRRPMLGVVRGGTGAPSGMRTLSAAV